MTKVEAIRFLEAMLNAERSAEDLAESGPLVVVERLMVEKPYGWVFNVQTAKYMETRDNRFRVIGGLWVFDTEDYSLTTLHTGIDLEEAIALYEKSR